VLNYRSAIRAHVSFETFKWILFKSEFVDPNFSKVFLMCRDLKNVFRPHSLISVHKTYPARTTLSDGDFSIFRKYLKKDTRSKSPLRNNEDSYAVKYEMGWRLFSRFYKIKFVSVTDLCSFGFFKHKIK